MRSGAEGGHVAPGLRADDSGRLDDDDDGDGPPDQVLERVGIVGQAGEHGAETPHDPGTEGGERGEEWHPTSRNRGMDRISDG